MSSSQVQRQKRSREDEVSLEKKSDKEPLGTGGRHLASQLLPQSIFAAVEKVHGRDEQVGDIVRYCVQASRGKASFPKHSSEKGDNKFCLCGTAGIVGIGKTELLLQVRERLKKETDLIPIYMTFGGDSMDLKGHFASYVGRYQERGVTPTNSAVQVEAFFSCVLKAIDPATSPTPYYDDNFHTILNRILSALQITTSDKTIVLLVDGIENLGDIALDVIKAVMDLVDFHDGEFVPVFAHSALRTLQKSAKLCRRQLVHIPLPLLPLNTWEKLDKGIVQLARQNKAVHQVCLSCAGHPRALFDGIPTAMKNFPPPDTRSTKKVLDSFRSTIIDRIQFNGGDNADIRAAVEAHLKIDKRVADNEEYPQWIRDGVVLEIKDGLSFPFPLRVQKWAEDNRQRIDLARHLNGVFDADAELTEESHQKKMEAIMFNYEAAIREVNKGWEGSLKNYFFDSAFMDPRLRTKRVGLPGSPSIEFLQDFSTGDLVVQNLEAGAIVVSESRTEDGFEYMVPFFRKVKEKDENGAVKVVEELFVGLVQCKFQQKPPQPWTAIKDGIHQSQGARTLTKQEVEYFPIIYTTIDLKDNEVTAETCQGAVVFNASNLFEFTNRLGVLRLHTEKLESVLKTKYPV